MTYSVIAIGEEEAAFSAAQTAVVAGEVIVLPTDTIYGVGALATSGAAVQRLLDAKERGRDMPPPVLVAEIGMVRALASGTDDRLTRLAEAFWPGALTVVLTARDSLRMDLGDRGDTIAVRVPAQEFTRELLRRTGPLAVSSANVHGRPAATTIAEAIGQLGERCAVYLDAGTVDDPAPSTIVDLTGVQARVLRAGRISIDELNAAVPGLIEVVSDQAPAGEPATVGGEVPAGGEADADATARTVDTPVQPDEA